MVVVMHKRLTPFAGAPPTAHPRVMETVNSQFEDVEPLFDVSAGMDTAVVVLSSLGGREL
ncbi:hypothetical protein Natgr_2303 [Natronobacterium gregoryi SP2]|uniref:Uncharacterized protein n=1 Tax=Natronobacterium gregoryi (strain ATCC 43098 / DSM 3393 / CCM 3738 / CIP 104747 / IAM 13177 / JCM 8860 / NBRC 102187 / NCIMB 2189 / SP2) TaxID=797304 RepID=L0AJ56_NATGS|nr:hypothetical protein Natgr_2303 [Natronobacterium gregoryi SP2]